MKRLILEELQVESFDTTPGSGVPRGTVHAHSGVESCGMTCANYPTYCGPGCGYTEDRTDCNWGSGNCTQIQYTCAQFETCVNGGTDCGSCAPQVTCDGSYTCQGTSYDNEIC